MDPFNFSGMTPSHFAAVASNVEIAAILITNGANVNSRASSTTTAL